MQVGAVIRQRCAWCGGILLDYDTSHVMVPEGQEGPTVAVWEVGDFVLTHEGMATLVVSVDEQALPDNACARLDPKITV